jgi:hypothetical protein
MDTKSLIETAVSGVVSVLLFLGLYLYHRHRGQVLLGRVVESQPLERQRRVAALSRMYTLAATSRPGSLARANWEDFMLARRKVEEIESRVNPGSLFRDGWSGTPQAWGFDAGWISRITSTPCKWREIGDFSPLPCVVEHGFSMESVQQGGIGDSYLVAALASTPTLSDLLDGAIVTAGASPVGVYCVRFFVHGHWEHVFVDALFPALPGFFRNADGAVFKEKDAASKLVDISPSAGRYALPYGACSTKPSEFWPALLEKAFAKLHGSYASISGVGSLNPRALELGSGVPLSFFTPDALPGFTALLTPSLESALWWKLEEVWKRGWAMTLTSKDGGGGLGAAFSSNQGIQRNHAFTVLKVQQVEVHHHTGGKGGGGGGGSDVVRLVQIRNPLARGEWTGAYSDRDTASWTPEVRQQTGWSPEASGDDGVFWMPFGEVIAYFKEVAITPILQPPEYFPGGAGGGSEGSGGGSSGWYRERVVVEWVGSPLSGPLQYAPDFTGAVLVEVTPTTPGQWVLIRRPVVSDYPPFVGTRGAAQGLGGGPAATMTPVPQVDTQLSFFPELIHVAMEVGQGPYLVDPLSLGLIEFASQAPFTVKVLVGGGGGGGGMASTPQGGSVVGRVLELPVYPGPPTPHPALLELHQLQYQHHHHHQPPPQPLSHQTPLSFSSLPPSSPPPSSFSSSSQPPSFPPPSSSFSSSSSSSSSSVLSSRPPPGPPPLHSPFQHHQAPPSTPKPLTPIRPMPANARSPFTQGDSTTTITVNPLVGGV